MMTPIDMARQIMRWEARRDSQGRLAVYSLPPNDGGGSFEVAGINDRYHPVQARALKALIEAGKHQEAAEAAATYLADYTEVAARWAARPAIQFFLRDTVFNRGATGAAKILQMAVGAKVDGKVGPATEASVWRFEAKRPLVLLARLRSARERYEREIVGVRANLWSGLENRWDNAFEVSAGMVLEQTT